jgi:hypothetical protein
VDLHPIWSTLSKRRFPFLATIKKVHNPLKGGESPCGVIIDVEEEEFSVFAEELAEQAPIFAM